MVKRSKVSKRMHLAALSVTTALLFTACGSESVETLEQMMARHQKQDAIAFDCDVRAAAQRGLITHENYLGGLTDTLSQREQYEDYIASLAPNVCPKTAYAEDRVGTSKLCRRISRLTRCSFSFSASTSVSVASFCREASSACWLLPFPLLVVISAFRGFLPCVSFLRAIIGPKLRDAQRHA